MTFLITRVFRPVSQYRPLIVNRHKIVKNVDIFSSRIRFNSSSTTPSPKPQSDSENKESSATTTASSENNGLSADGSPLNESDHLSADHNPAQTESKPNPEPVPKATPEEVIKKGQEAEKAQEKDDQANVQATTGVIEKKAREGLIYFSNMYPIVPISSEIASKALSFAFGLTEPRVLSFLTHNSLSADIPVNFTQIIPRYKDGGVFARFTLNEDAPDKITPKDIESLISQHMKTHEHRAIFNPFRRIKVFSVLGIPWIEDLHRNVSNKVRVIFEGGEVLNQETVYAVLRRYGPIKDITTQNDPKDPVKSAIVEYLSTRDASTARNCVNSLIVQNTQIHITYIPAEGGINAITKSIMDHPRISIPILLALFTALAVFVFNPIRVWFIEHKITKTTLPSFIENNSIVRWARSTTKSTLLNIGKYLHKPADELSHSFQSLWIERQKSVTKIKRWLQENVNTFIVVTGPRGNGKQELVSNFVLKDRDNVLTIDCEQLLKSQNDPAFIRAAASQIGYYPVFPWMNNIATYLDLIIQGLTGQKSGFAESTEQQLKNMLSTATASLRQVALSDYQTAVKSDSSRNGYDTPASSQLTEESYLQLHPESKPVVVISHYLARVDSNYQFVYKQLAEFASVLVQANLAHVIFITNDVTYESTLTPALPNRIFKVAGVGDADSKDAKRFVLNQIMEARRSEVKASEEKKSEGDGPTVEKKKPDDLYNSVDSAAQQAKEQAAVDKIKEELKKEEEDQKGNIAARILTYTTSPFQSSEKADAGDAASMESSNTSADAQGATGAVTSNTPADGDSDDFDDPQTLDIEFPYLDYALTPLGGRLTDLQSFARRLKSGEQPLDATADMVSQSAAEIYQMFLVRNQRMTTGSTGASSSTATASEWTQEQAWTLIKLLGGLSLNDFSKERQIALAESGRPAGSDRGVSKLNKYSNISHKARESEPEVSVSFLFQDPNFKTKEQQKALNALQQAEMITLVHENGRNVAIKAGKPLYQAAFKALICDKVLYAIQETSLLGSLVVSENKKIRGLEDELQLLGTVNRSYEVKQRIKYLEAKLLASQTNVSKYESKMKEMAGIMAGK